MQIVQRLARAGYSLASDYREAGTLRASGYSVTRARPAMGLGSPGWLLLELFHTHVLTNRFQRLQGAARVLGAARAQVP